MDGTFNQTKPLVRFVPSYTCFSYDLKSAYGSWPIFAFTPLVWWAAEQVRPGIRFDKYAVLGDDVLITDPLVAEQYRLGLRRLGVKISPSKSLISSTGAAEFAKRFLVKGVDLFPISMITGFPPSLRAYGYS